MSDLIHYIEKILRYDVSKEERSYLESRKRQFIEEKEEHSSVKMRILNGINRNKNNIQNWSEINPSIKATYLRHFPNASIREVVGRPAISTRPVNSNVIDISKADHTRQSLELIHFKGNESNRLPASVVHSSRPVKADFSNVETRRKQINNCKTYQNPFRPDEQELYRDILAKSSKTSAVYAKSIIDYPKRKRLNKMVSQPKVQCDTTPLLIYLTTEKSNKIGKAEARESTTIKNSESIRRKEPLIDSNYNKTKKEYKSTRNGTKQPIKEVQMKPNKLNELDREKANVLLESKMKTCTITDVIHKKVAAKLYFPDFTIDQKVRIKEALNCKNPDYLFNESFKLRITGADLNLLNEKQWLNDDLINFYVNMIQERSVINSNLPRVFAFSTFFYPKLTSSGYSSLRLWTKRVDVFSFDILLVPIFLGIHWCLATIDFRDHSIRYYDSMLGVNNDCIDTLEQYLQKEYKDKKKTNYYTSNWQKVIMKEIPRQLNGSDCGVFCCTFAEFITRNAKILFSQKHMPYIRWKMVIEIIEGRLLT